MSVDTNQDFSHINDEDVLRKMWQEADDFGRKKEIRSQMYKLREARLRDFYNSGEVNTEIQRTTESKSFNKSTHADLLADHSFMSLKSKEIRDSESPTRDVNYKIADKYNDQGWSVHSSQTTSEDDKTKTSKRVIATSGTEIIDGGKLDFAARNEQKSLRYEDGDDKNYTKTYGSSSNTIIEQNAVGGDENSSFKSSSKKVSSSSKTVSTHKSSSGEIEETYLPTRTITVSDDKILPAYSNGKTKVSKETKTLPDGTIVTSTRYETVENPTIKEYVKEEQKVSVIKNSSTSGESYNKNYSETEVLNSNLRTTKPIKYISNNDKQKTTNFKYESVENGQDVRNDVPIKNITYITEKTKTINNPPTSDTIVIEATCNKNITNRETEVNDSFVNITKCEQDRNKPKVRQESPKRKEFQTPEKRSPIKPRESDFETTTIPTEGQYDTTYRTDFPSKRVSVEVSPTHDAFARSLRAVTPDRISRSSPSRGSIRSLQTSTTSLRSSTSPEKSRYPSKVSPDRLTRERSVSPKKVTRTEKKLRSPEKKTEEHYNIRSYYNSELVSNVEENKNRNSIERKKKSKSRSLSPSTTASDIEFITRSNDIVTDLDADCDIDLTVTVARNDVKNNRSSNLEFNSQNIKKVTSSQKNISKYLQNNEIEKSNNELTTSGSLTDTYEERCKQILGLANENTERQRNNYNRVTRIDEKRLLKDRTSSKHFDRSSSKTEFSNVELTDTSKIRKSPQKTIPKIESLDHKDISPQRETFKKFQSQKTEKVCSESSTIKENASQIKKSEIRRSPEKKTVKSFKEATPRITEIPAQVRKTPETDYQEKNKSKKIPSATTEIPSQIRRTPEKETLGNYPENKKPQKSAPTINEFPSQIRRTPEKETLGNYPENKKPQKSAPTINEFPSQIRRTPEKEPLEKYPENKKPQKSAPTINEFPSQVRRTPEKEPLGNYPENRKPQKSAPTIDEFPSQIRKTPERETLEKYPENKKPQKLAPTINEFPSHVRRTPEKEPLEKYPENKKPQKSAPTINEFPSQIRRTPEKETLGNYPENKKPQKSAPTIDEFPSQIRKTPERETLEKYPENKKPQKSAPTINEFPSQIRRTPEKEPLGNYPENKKPQKSAPTINEFPSQVRRTPEKEPLENYPESKKPQKSAPTINEFPSQIRKAPEKETLEKFPENKKPQKSAPTINEFPSQIRKTEKESSEIESNISKTEIRTIDIEENEPLSVHLTVSLTPEKQSAVKKNYTATAKTNFETKEIPVEEPLATKRFLNQLCQAENEQRRSTTKEIPEDFLPSRNNKFVVTDQVEKTKNQTSTVNKNNEFIIKEKQSVVSTERKSKPLSKTFLEDNKETKEVNLSRKNVVNTLLNVDNLDEMEEDTSVHIRTHRIDNPLKKTGVNGVCSKNQRTKPLNNEIKKKQVQPKTTIKQTKSNIVGSSTKTNLTPKTHTVTATITVNTKTDSNEKIVNKRKNTKSKIPTKPNKLNNGDLISDSEKETTNVNEVIIKKSAGPKISRTRSDQVIKVPEKSQIQRGQSKPELISNATRSSDVTKSRKLEKKCISTKSIIINNTDNEDKEIIVDLQRSKSSREPTPDRVCPLPVSSEEDNSTPRYPDHITEPDDGLNRTKLKKLSDLPIFENQIIDITKNVSKITEVDKVDETDDSLLSVDKKINKFLDTAEKLTRGSLKSDCPPPKVNRPKLSANEDLEDDAYLLNVSDKVSKFITAAEDLISNKSKNSKCINYLDNKETEDSELNSCNAQKLDSTEIVTNVKTFEKVSPIPSDKKTTTTSQKEIKNKITDQQIENEEHAHSRLRLQSPERSTSPQRSSKLAKLEEDTKSILSTTSRLRSTESVKKAKALFENISKDQPTLKQYDILSRPSVFQGRKINIPEKKEIKKAEEVKEKSPERERDIEENCPNYMRPLDRSLRPNSPHRENISQRTPSPNRSERLPTKFGVSLKRTDSGRALTCSSSVFNERRNSKITLKEEEINEIFDLVVLEELLEKVVEYELRRKIRTQIRIVKKLMSENNSSVENEKLTKQSQSEYSTKLISAEKRGKSPDKTVSPETTRSAQNHIQNKINISTEKKSTILSTLKKSDSTNKTVAEDNKPEWVKHRTLKKVSENTPIKKITRTPIKKDNRSSPVKETKPTDLITSSYGVGPTDENGTPLFGLRALRMQKGTERSKVQGTIIQSEYFSKNGEEPTGQVRVTKYSTDPKDLNESCEFLTNENNGLTSVTTTQKFGYKDTPSLKSLTTDDKDESLRHTKSTKVTRRNSVKALSQKFIEPDTLKSEKQSTYPKAGLILRTNSFKDSSSEKDKNYQTSEEHKTMTIESSRIINSGESFLSNKTKISGLRDVVHRIQSKDEVDGENEEDAQARDLLNKFIGSQVILSGLESQTISKSFKTTPTSNRTTKITRTIMEGGKPKSTTLVFQQPITERELKTIWDEQTLRLLLEQSSDYEERRIIRARLRQVMAEQEACTDLVEKASQEQTVGIIDGESLLLPLLQGLLEAPDKDQTPDSGTESGEDLRNGLIAEVQNALDKLSASLRSDITDITPERRSSLLNLVTKLQAGLSQSSSPPSSSINMERRSSGQGRFNKRRQRQNRHTVGVSSEELADARRLIEEISLPSQANIQALQKENSESSVSQNSNSSFKQFNTNKSVVKNAVAKPFTNSNSVSRSVSGNSSSVQTPTEPSESLCFLFNEEPEITRNFNYTDAKQDHPNESESNHIQNIDIKQIQQSVQQAAVKILTENMQESETDDDSNTVKANSLEQNLNIELQKNPIYHQPIKSESHSNQTENEPKEKKTNKFNSKKIKMKRANTIDIPKPKYYYENNEEKYGESDSSLPDDDVQRRRNTYYALRGPVRVGYSNPSAHSNLPVFEPKTDSDKKFIAFINKHNDDNNKSANTTMWSGKTAKTPTWGNKFGNIKNNFETVTTTNPPQNAARLFWKTNEGVGSKNFPQTFEKKLNHQSNLPWSGPNNTIVNGSLRVNTKMSEQQTQQPINKFSHAPQSVFKPILKKNLQQKPNSLQFPSDKLEPKQKEPESPLYLYSPKPLFSPSSDSSNSSPVTSKPWLSTAGEHRVLSLAATKFENKPEINLQNKENHKVSLPVEKVTAPYLIKSSENNRNSVRRLSGQFDKPKPVEFSSQIQVKYNIPPQNQKNWITHQEVQPQIYYQHVPGQNDEQYISNANFVPLKTDEPTMPKNEERIHNFHEPILTHTSASKKEEKEPYTNEMFPETKPKYETAVEPPRKLQSQVSSESVKEYVAVSSKIMSSPVSQQAVTVRQKSPMNRTEHDLEAALNLRTTLQRVGNKSTSSSPSDYQNTKSTANTVSPKLFNKTAALEESTSDVYKPSQPFYDNDLSKPLMHNSKIKKDNRNFGIVKPMLQKPISTPKHSIEINERGESVLTSQFQIPVINIPKEKSPASHSQMLSKSDSWHQICLQQQQPQLKTTSKSPPSLAITKSKSSHSLALPKQFEAGMTKDEMQIKKKAMEAYLGTSTTNPIKMYSNSDKKPQVVKRSINRLKTSEKVSSFQRTSSENFCTTKRKTISQRSQVTTSQISTTNVTSKKPMSPFAKFQQLDKQNSVKTPPSTPNTPSGSGLLFKFTDPALSQSASTIKDRLLYWCRMKTKEYENVQLDNFSTSWADGLAFCALIHHFLPEAFDYQALTPKNRRHNFTLAFQIADEKADIAPLLDVDDMVATRKPDWKCVFTYVQSIYRRFKDDD